MNNSKADKKSAARLYTLQALFQMEATDQSAQDVRQEFLEHRFGAKIEGDQYKPGDVKHFEALLHTALTHQREIDQMTDQALAQNWPIDRIDPTLRALFRAAGAELILGETPPKALINEFVELAHAFYPTGKESKFTNAVLDHMYRAKTKDSA